MTNEPEDRRVNAGVGWALAVLAIAVGYASYGWPGVALGVTIIVFWLLLQFSRTLRVMRTAAQSPVGRVANAVMFNARLSKGMRLIDVIRSTRSLGQRVSEVPEVWRWSDDGGAAVALTFENGRLAHWTLVRPEGDDAP